MSDPVSPPTSPPATDADGNLLLTRDEARALLRQCCAQFLSSLVEVVSVSIDGTNDLFEQNKFVSDDEVMDFRNKRAEWIKRFEQTLKDLIEKRLNGQRRQGRRPDADRSVASLRVLNAFDHEKQAALTTATQFLRRLTRHELGALDLRVAVLLGEPRVRDIDNPFAPDYILDAVGVTARALLPNPRLWRPLMERVLADLTPAATKTYIRLNRLLADRQVLPEIKAELRARSELRPVDDRELLPVFERLITEVAPPSLTIDVAVPAASEPTAVAQPSSATLAPVAAPEATGAAAPAAVSASAPAGTAATASAPLASQSDAAAAAETGEPARPPAAPVPAAGVLAAVMAPPPGSINPYMDELARAAPLLAAAAAAAPSNAFGLPQLDPMLALGSLSAIVAALDRWQVLDPAAAGAAGAAATETPVTPGGTEGVIVPLNRIPWIRAAVADKVINPTDKITIDVIALLFDYIFRDPSIPESLRSLFGRLQVPILKAALLDRTFFSDKKHPARRLLDHLAAAAIGATSDEGYRVGFELVAAGVIDEVCRDFKVDVAVFDAAERKLQEFIDAEQRKAAALLGDDVAAAIVAEESEADRSQVRALIRDKLTGIKVPFEVRGFAETIWVDYLTLVRKRDGTESDAWNGGVKTVDDLLWSIAAKERNAQKARLTKMVPGLIRSLRSGGAAVEVREDRMQPFLEAVYQLHIAAIRPKAAERVAAELTEADAANVPTLTKIVNVHDFVAEMVVGTWLAFDAEGRTINARLSWISPMRTKYIFTTRSRGRALAVSPEELAWQLRDGSARLIVEPVPLFDRAVSSALDELAANKPGQAAAD
ncbi:MAG TPA: DUF1631 family protein [Casimicrobiaceae bacterium]|jgi:hypothetical protein|nr:DUF1631 family protein [Casimicrobiaceae bacterium]